MKKTILAVALVMASGVMADDLTKSEMAHCARVEKMAGTVMSNRQHGTLMKDMMNAAQASDVEAANKLAMSIVEAAYAHPDYQTKEVEDETIIEFRNKMYLECYRAMK